MRHLWIVPIVGLLAHPAQATSDGCASVIADPRIRVVLREGPAMRAPQITLLQPGEELGIDTARCGNIGTESVCDETNEWVHVTTVPRLDDDAKTERFTRGWAESRHLDYRRCPDE